jgi:hypothetical protein
VIRGLYPYRRLYYAVCMCIVYVSSMTMSIWAVQGDGRVYHCHLPRRAFSRSCLLSSRPQALADMLRCKWRLLFLRVACAFSGMVLALELPARQQCSTS